MPWHDDPTPEPTHVWFVHVVGLPQVPVAVQLFCTVRLAHSVWVGAHIPVHDAVVPLMTHVWFVHVVESAYAPDPLHE